MISASDLGSIRYAFRYAYRDWFPASEYERAQGPEFELYDAEFHVDQTVYLYFPVKAT